MAQSHLRKLNDVNTLNTSSQNGSPTIKRSALSDFHLFPKLPIEMRSLVWKTSLPTTRTVLLCLKKIPAKGNEHSEEFKLNSPCAIPIAFRVCKESRLEAKRHYQLAFSNSYHEGRIYFNFNRDIVYMVSRENYAGNEVDISPRKLRMLLDPAEADRIEKMAVSSIYSETPQELVQFQGFGGLKELSVEFETRDLAYKDATAGDGLTLIEEEKFRMLTGQPPIDDMGKLDRAFVLEMFHEARKAFPVWKAPNLRFVSSGTDVVGDGSE